MGKRVDFRWRRVRLGLGFRRFRAREGIPRSGDCQKIWKFCDLGFIVFRLGKIGEEIWTKKTKINEGVHIYIVGARRAGR